MGGLSTRFLMNPYERCVSSCLFVMVVLHSPGTPRQDARKIDVSY